MDNAAGPGHPPLSPSRHAPRHVTNALFFPSFEGYDLERATPAALARVHQDAEQTVEPSGRSATAPSLSRFCSRGPTNYLR